MNREVFDPLFSHPVDPFTAEANQRVVDYWRLAARALLAVTDPIVEDVPELVADGGCYNTRLGRAVAHDILAGCDIPKMPPTPLAAFTGCVEHLVDEHNAGDVLAEIAEDPAVSAILDQFHTAKQELDRGMNVRGSG